MRINGTQSQQALSTVHVVNGQGGLGYRRVPMQYGPWVGPMDARYPLGRSASYV